MGLLEDTMIPLTLDFEIGDVPDDGDDDGAQALSRDATRDTAPAPQRKRDLQMQKQQQSNWCWAATTISILRFYESSSTMTQCQLVNKHFGRSDCCSSPSSSNCNQGSNTGDALKLVGHLREDRAGALAFKDVQTEIAGVRPIVVKIVWSGGGAHAIAIDGYASSTNANWVYGDDPWTGNSFVYDYNSFKTSYGGSGSWDRSRLTK